MGGGVVIPVDNTTAGTLAAELATEEEAMHPAIIEAVAAQRDRELRASSPGTGSAGVAGLRWLWCLVAGDSGCGEAESR